VKGLLGNYDGEPKNDFRAPDGQLLPDNASERDIFKYASRCKLVVRIQLNTKYIAHTLIRLFLKINALPYLVGLSFKFDYTCVCSVQYTSINVLFIYDDANHITFMALTVIYFTGYHKEI